MNFKDKVCVVTGASSGIGRALVEELIDQQAILYIAARRLDRLLELKKKFPEAQIFTYQADVTSADQVQDFIDGAKKRHQKIDLLIANAGFGVTGSFENLKTLDYRRQFEVNVFGVLETISKALPLIQKGGGRIVIVGSAMSYFSFAENSPYAMSKFAVRALSESLSYELRKDGVSTTLVCPGYIRSEIRKKNNEGEVVEAATDPIPQCLQLSAKKCARRILKAAWKRKREKIITFHAALGIWFKRFFPNLFYKIIRRLPVRAARDSSL